MTERPIEPTPADDAFVADLLGHLAPPEIPAEMRDPAFLEAIYERAADVEEARLGPVLAPALTPVPVPDAGDWDQVAWRELPADPAVGEQVAELLAPPQGPVPGLLWTRIRAAIREQRADHRRAENLRWIRRAAAALLISAGLVGVLHYGSTYFDLDGTPQDLRIVFREDPGLGTSGLDQLLGR